MKIKLKGIRHRNEKYEWIHFRWHIVLRIIWFYKSSFQRESLINHSACIFYSLLEFSNQLLTIIQGRPKETCTEQFLEGRRDLGYFVVGKIHSFLEWSNDVAVAQLLSLSDNIQSSKARFVINKCALPLNSMCKIDFFRPICHACLHFFL